MERPRGGRQSHVVKSRRAISLPSLAALTTLLLAPGARACPLCAAGLRAQVHAAIFDGSFAETLAMTALPFGVLAAILAAILAGPRRGRGRRD
jgi:hypothetical protein